MQIKKFPKVAIVATKLNFLQYTYIFKINHTTLYSQTFPDHKEVTYGWLLDYRLDMIGLIFHQFQKRYFLLVGISWLSMDTAYPPIPMALYLLALIKTITNITVTSLWARWRLKSPASALFTQLFIQMQIKENIKAPRHWPLCGEFTGHRWIPRTNGPGTRKMFPFDDVIMMSQKQHMPS